MATGTKKPGRPKKQPELTDAPKHHKNISTTPYTVKKSLYARCIVAGKSRVVEENIGGYRYFDTSPTNMHVQVHVGRVSEPMILMDEEGLAFLLAAEDPAAAIFAEAFKPPVTKNPVNDNGFVRDTPEPATDS